MSYCGHFVLVRHPSVTSLLDCFVTSHPATKGILWRQTIVASTARAKRYPTCEISILFTAIFTGYHVRKLDMLKTPVDNHYLTSVVCVGQERSHEGNISWYVQFMMKINSTLFNLCMMISLQVLMRDSLCTICVTRRKDCFYIPCGHSFCMPCACQMYETNSLCPVCRSSVTRVQSIFDWAWDIHNGIIWN